MFTFSLGVLTMWAVQKIADYARSPYRWKCPVIGCDSSVKSSDKAVMEKAREIHEEIHPRQ